MQMERLQIPQQVLSQGSSPASYRNAACRPALIRMHFVWQAVQSTGQLDRSYGQILFAASVTKGLALR